MLKGSDDPNREASWLVSPRACLIAAGALLGTLPPADGARRENGRASSVG